MKPARRAKLLPIALAGMLAFAPALLSQSASPIEKRRNLAFPPAEENFEKGWQERVSVEFELVNDADVKSLRDALNDKTPYVRALAARALGIRGDKEAAATIADLLKNDPEHIVRIRAVEALGMLKLEAPAIEAAIKDRNGGVRWSAKISAGQLTNKTDFAALARQSYAGGMSRESMGLAEVGKPAPEFTALTVDGKPFKFSLVLGKKPIAIYFAAFDG
jgi:hypothetical protein